RGLLRRGCGLGGPAVPRELHRGRYLGDPARHHRRTGARAARRAAHRHPRSLEGPAAVTTVSPGERPPGTPRWPAAPLLRHGALAATADSSTEGARSREAVPDLRYSDAEEQLRARARARLAGR